MRVPLNGEEIKYSEMTLAALWSRYKTRCSELGEKPVRPMPKSRTEVARLLALAMTRNPPKPSTAAPAQVIRISPAERRRRIIIEGLCEVDVTTSNRVTRGFSYSVVLARIRKRTPDLKVDCSTLRVYASYIRQNRPGFQQAVLPMERPRSNKGAKHGTRVPSKARSKCRGPDKEPRTQFSR